MIDLNFPFSPTPEDGKQFLIFEFEEPLQFSDIFDGVPQFYPGSVIQIQEIAELFLSIEEPAKIDVDFRWFDPKKRLGTYQLIDAEGGPSRRENDDGYLNYTSQKFIRRSNYTITANPQTPFGKHEQIALDNCNAYLTAEVYLFPGDVTPDAGFRYYDRNPLFLGSNTISKAPLVNRPFFQLISGIALALSPGVSAISVNYKVGVINAINTDYEAVSPPTCEFLGTSCNAQFTAFLLDAPGSRFSNPSECQDNNGSNGACTQFTYVSPTDPTCIRQYFVPTQN